MGVNANQTTIIISGFTRGNVWIAVINIMPMVMISGLENVLSVNQLRNLELQRKRRVKEIYLINWDIKCSKEIILNAALVVHLRQKIRAWNFMLTILFRGQREEKPHRGTCKLCVRDVMWEKVIHYSLVDKMYVRRCTSYPLEPCGERSIDIKGRKEIGWKIPEIKVFKELAKWLNYLNIQ